MRHPCPSDWRTLRVDGFRRRRSLVRRGPQGYAPGTYKGRSYLRPFCAKLVGYRTLRQHLYRSAINSAARLRPDDYATTTPIAKPNSICLTNYLGPGVDGFGLASKLAKPNALLEQIWNTLVRSVLSAHLRLLQRIDADNPSNSAISDQRMPASSLDRRATRLSGAAHQSLFPIPLLSRG
jgi:hypothetical protein